MGKHLHNCIISLRRKAWAHETSLTSTTFCWCACTKPEQSCVIEVSILPKFRRFSALNLEWCWCLFTFFILLKKIKKHQSKTNINNIQIQMYRWCHRGQMSSDLPTGLVVVYKNLHGILSLQLIEWIIFMILFFIRMIFLMLHPLSEADKCKQNKWNHS